MKNINVKELHEDSENLEVFVFNVGQGDHILLKFPGMEYGIIDFFYDIQENIVEPPSLSYFKELKRTLKPEEFKNVSISFFCISHTDKDHVKGVSETMEWLYENDVHINDVWLSAARDESQLIDFLKVKIPALIKNKLGDSGRRNYGSLIAEFKSNIDNFFKYFEKWKVRRGDFCQGEYLTEIRSLRQPSKLEKSQALNLGPLSTQLEHYHNNLTLEVLKKFLGITDKKSEVDKNHISHILNIKFGQSSLLFGGDTHKKIWEQCLKKYHDTSFPFLKMYGKIDSRFIKVSHHGSKTSTSKEIWSRVLPATGDVHLSISAGRNTRYKHPNDETMKDIRNVRKDANIHCTNICTECLRKAPLEKEYHIWYDKYRNRYSKVASDEKMFIEEMLSKVIVKPEADDDSDILGLFAFIYEIPDTLDKDVKVRIALTKTNNYKKCFYSEHKEKLSPSCNF